MRFRLSRWNANHLLAAWCVYWAGLVAWGLGSAIPALRRLQGENTHGSASMSFDNGAFHFTVLEGAVTTWSANISYRSVLLLATIPPLILWALWLRSQRRRREDPLTGAIGSGDGRVETMTFRGDRIERDPRP
jgi:hypothetical protein